ncbi:MAG: hypothetical protein RIC55_09905 [Pirellulaceae bacterium]
MEQREQYYGGWAGWDNEFWYELDMYPPNVPESVAKLYAMIRQDQDLLTARAIDHVSRFIDRSIVEFADAPFINDISFRVRGQGSCLIRVEMRFDRDERAYWWVVFNVPQPFEPFPTGQRQYCPLGWGRHIE